MRPASASAWSAGRSAETRQAAKRSSIWLGRALRVRSSARFQAMRTSQGRRSTIAASCVLALEDADEDVLDNVFGLGRVAQDGERDAVEQAGVVAHERGEIGLSYIS